MVSINTEMQLIHDILFQPSWLCVDYNVIPSSVRASIHYQAPECVKATTIGPPSDIFSFGILICCLHAPNNPLWNCRKDLSSYKRYLEELKSLISSARSFDLPESLKDTVKLMLHGDPNLRPDSYQFVKVYYTCYICYN